ncbi:MAG: BON domain-containing protein [Pseudomonadales bacterium]|nr:BON domain-containing protein [Pseudomonadales bacterium]
MNIYQTAILTFFLLTTSCTPILVRTTGPEGMQEDPGVRTAGAMVEDEAIETRIVVNMKSREPEFRKANFNVISHNAVVLIVGQVQSDALKAQASQIAAETSSKIKRIHNELEVSGKTTMLSRMNDSWISTKVRTQMRLNDEVPAARIRVVTNNGSVYLMGMISQEEGDRAALLARNVTGVSRVVKVFEYL